MFLPKWSMKISTYPVTLILRLYQKFFTERVHENFHVSCNIETNVLPKNVLPKGSMGRSSQNVDVCYEAP